jgi:hypothetical protein
MMESTGRPRGRFFCFCVLFALLANMSLPVAVWAAPQKTNVSELKTHIRWIVGNGNEGKMQELEKRLQKQEATLQRLAGVGAALMAVITILNLAIHSWSFLRQ